MPFMTTQAVAALSDVEELAGRALSTQQIIEEIAHRIVQVIEVDAFFAASTDPDTSLCLGAGLVYDMSGDLCQPFWEHEFLIPDYNKFADLTPGDAVGDLREATGGKLARSPRYRTLNAIADLEGELRVVCHAGGRSWGNVQLNRRTGGRPFSDADRGFLRALAPVAGSALLTQREVQVTRLVARGRSTDEIASTLFLSQHTVRDHLKAIFEKVGVRSRGELTSKLFAENYQPLFDEAIVNARERTDARMSGLAVDA